MKLQIMDKLYKGYIYKKALEDLSTFALKNAKYAQKGLRNIDFDKKYWLHKAGLTTYSPAKRTIGSLSLLFAGAIIGGIVGLVLAPMPGENLRLQVKDKAKKLVPIPANAPEMSARA